MQKTFDTYSFGCRVNVAEMEALSNQLSTAGFVQEKNNPQLFIINTCAVTRKAEREARQLIYQTKKKMPATKIIATGCAATKWNIEKTKVAGIDYLFDNTDKEYLAKLIQKRISNKKVSTTILTRGDASVGAQAARRISVSSTALGNASGRTPKLKLPSDKFLSSGRLLLKIQDGCHRFCTFCIVPYLRGQPKSTSIQNVESQIKNYGGLVKEVTLTAINTEAYGRDTKESFIQLIDTILKKTTVPRISFGSIHPWSINDEFFSFYKKVLPKKRIVDFFHIPLQSGCNKILTLMKRGYTREEFVEKLEALKKINPFAFIGTDVIVGFLEETDKDFEDTYRFMKDSPITKFHIFRFSPRERTAAYFMKKRLYEPTPEQKMKRAKALEELHRKKYQEFLQKHVEQTFSALFLEKREEGYQHVLLSNQIPARIKSPKDNRGELREVRIEKLTSKGLMGQLS